MKFYITLISIFASLNLFAQEEANLLGTWSDSTLVGSFAFDNIYNEIWGYATKNNEYAIIGTTAGTHVIDVTDPTNPTEIILIPGKVADGRIIHRDYHDHKGFLYAVADEGPSSLQIMDLSYLPDSLPVVYDSDSLVVRTHNIFIDTIAEKMYTCINRGGGMNYYALRIFDISDPLNPDVIGEYNDISGLPIQQVHDAYINNDTAFLNIGNQGFVIAEFSDPLNPRVLSVLESSDYPQSGYNHSGWLSEDKSTYYMADETWGRDIKVLDVRDFENVEVLDTIDAGSENQFSIPHNLVVSCDKLYASYYYDGLQVYDISDPQNPIRTHYLQTSNISHRDNYEGAWGVYPFLPSGNILVSDMQEGLFVIENIGNCGLTSTAEILPSNTIEVFPNPANEYLNINFRDLPAGADVLTQWKTIDGRNIGNSISLALQDNIQLKNLPTANGIYLLTLQNENFQIVKKVFIHK
jgi:choice-of-anchor B domain-containing protein